MRLVILGAALLCWTTGARLAATSYYVDYAGGNDSNDGLRTSSAWQHCPGDPAAGDAAAACVPGPGDTVYFKGGVTYELTSPPGIALRWDGAISAPLTYDGNRANAWGQGRARFTNHHGTPLAAFSADAPRHDLVFQSLDIEAIGGAAALPPDSGSPLAPRYGGGIVFRGGAATVLVADCVFAELGFWFNQRPMDAQAIAGAGIACQSICRGLTVAGCHFARAAIGCDFSQATQLEHVSLTDCTFGDAMLWSIGLPPLASGVSTADVITQGCTELDHDAFDSSAWSGYGNSPRVDVALHPAGATAVFVAAALASPAPSFQWFKNGVPIPGATASELRLTNLSLLDTGLYAALATNSAGSTLSSAAVLAVTPSLSGSALGTAGTSPTTSSTSATPAATTAPTTAATSAPVFTIEPASQTAEASGTATFSVNAIGSPAPSYQWRKNGQPIAGWTNAALTLPALTSNDNGTYDVIAMNSAGATASRGATLLVAEAATAPAAIAVPATAMASVQAIVGAQPASTAFTVGGSTTRPVLIRALGPALAALGIGGALSDPRLEVYRDGVKIGENDNWGGSAALSDLFARVGALPLVDATSRDSALLMWLPPGTYTALVASVNGASGVTLADVYLVP